VTYTIIIEAPNPDQKLMPGMTATANIFINEIKDVLTLSNKAFRFNPDQKTLSVMMKGKPLPENNAVQRNEGRDKIDRQKSNQPEGEAGKSASVWVKKGADFYRTRIQTGLSDGTNTEIKSGLNEGDEVVVSAGLSEKASAPSTAANSPFMPRRPSQRTTPRR
jgi:HlyD family secretion protein